jgi:hypothetical protein
MKSLCILLAFACPGVGAYASSAFDPVLAHPQLWSLDQDGFQKE